MVSPAIQFSSQLCRDEFRLTRRNGRESLPATYAVQPAPAEPRLIEQTMNARAPDTTILTCSAFIAPLVAFQDFRCLNLETRVGDSTTGAPHMDFIATNWLEMFHAMKQRRGTNLPADLWRIKLRRHIENA